MSRITLATFKAFIRKNSGNLYLKVRTHFDGMTDCCEPTHDAYFAPVEPADHVYSNNLGLRGVWLVGHSADYFTPFSEGCFKGYEVYNCCGQFILCSKTEVQS